MGRRIAEFFRGVRSELRQVAWPTRPEVARSFTVVLVTLVFMVGAHLLAQLRLLARSCSSSSRRDERPRTINTGERREATRTRRRPASASAAPAEARPKVTLTELTEEVAADGTVEAVTLTELTEDLAPEGEVEAVT